MGFTKLSFGIALLCLIVPSVSLAWGNVQFASIYQNSSYYVQPTYAPVNIGYAVPIGTPYYGNTPSYTYPTFYGYPQQNLGYVGYTDFWGSRLCYWQGYGVSDCSFNPHQWVYDPYSGTWH